MNNIQLHLPQYRPGAKVHSAMAWIALIGSAIVTYAVFRTPLEAMNYADCIFYAITGSTFLAHNACCYNNSMLIYKKPYDRAMAFSSRSSLTVALWVTSNAIAFGYVFNLASTLPALTYLTSSSLSLWGVYLLFKKWMYSRYYLDYETESIKEISARIEDLYKTLTSYTKPNYEDDAQYKIATNAKNLAEAQHAKKYFEARILKLQNQKI